MLHRFLPFFLSLVFLNAQSPSIQGQDLIGQEADRRHEALIKEGYNLTYGFSWGGPREKNPIRLELLVPETSAEHLFSIWLETREGEAALRLLDKAGQSLLSWSGRKGEMVLSRRMLTGKYTLEIDASRASAGRAEFGVKGPFMPQCLLDRAQSQEYPATPAKGFHWPYLLCVPKEVRSPYLLVVPNNTVFATEELELLRASASCEIKRQSAVAERLGCPLLVPMFPRPSVQGEEENLYLHALSRASILTKAEAWKRVDLQLLAMIQDAQAHLRGKGVMLNPKVLLSGFSASGSFVNRFALLHPEHVKAVACGSPGGWPLAPVSELEGEKLDYPVGIADLETLTGSRANVDALKRIRWFFFQGDQDTNDAVPGRDSFSRTDEQLVFRLFGTTPVARWKPAERLYLSQGFQARFALYPGVSHVVTPQIETDITRFFMECMEAGNAPMVPAGAK